MPYRKYAGNNPKRRIAHPDAISREIQLNLANARYVGRAYHKTRPSDYGFDPPARPRPHKSVCDDHREIRKREAVQLFRSGVKMGMVSSYPEDGPLPKYVWAVDDLGEPYEAKLGDDGASYHGYRLHREQRMRKYIATAWRERNS